MNYVVSGILWPLGILTLLFGYLGPRNLFHLAGFGCICFAPIALIVEISVTIYLLVEQEKKYLFPDLLSLGITAAMILLAFFL